MKDNQEIYKALKSQYDEQELAENFYVAKKMTAEEQQASDEEISNIRKRMLQEMSSEDKIYSGLLGLKYQMQHHIEHGNYDPNKSVASFLKEYMTVLHKKQKDLAHDLDVHKTRLSRILNNRERLSIQLAYRLEIHSANLIPAILWWRLLQKEVEKEIKEDIEERNKEQAKVKNIAYPST